MVTVLTSVGVSGLFIGALAMGFTYSWLERHILSSLPDNLSGLQAWRPPTVVTVYDRDSEPIDLFYVERRIWRDLHELPPHVWQAFVAAEDRRFFDHPGVDAIGIARAFWTNLQEGEISQGGSTLTQQLVKQLIVGDERSYERKLKEAVLAWRLERELTKEQILELYMNYVFLGAGNYGIQAAAEDYFGVSAEALDPGQAALIAGLIPAPSRYNPRRQPEEARIRRAVVLRVMVEEGYVDPIDAIDYLGDPVVVPLTRGENRGPETAYVTMVRREIRRVVGNDAAFQAGLHVFTPYDPIVTRAADKAVRAAVAGVEERQGVAPEAAALVIENATGRVIAAVDSVETPLEGFVRATQARRQPGSSFKPYVYAVALRDRHTQIDVVQDAPLNLPAGGGRTWSPGNYGGGFFGPVRLREAMAKSLNTVAVRLILESGAAEVVRTARAMGVRTPLRQDPTIALGSSEVTVLDQALGFATLARMGVPVEPVWVDRLEDDRGRLVALRGEPVVVGGRTLDPLPGAPLPRALPAGVAYELVDMLREVVQSGTAVRARDPRFDRIGKTGTTNDFIDAWYVGSTPRYTIAVWVGSVSQTSMGDRETGGRSALPAWLAIVDALDQPAGERFPVPDEAVLVRVGDRWMGFPRGRVPRGALAARPVDDSPLAPFPGLVR